MNIILVKAYRFFNLEFKKKLKNSLNPKIKIKKF